MTSAALRLEARGITKSFPGVRAVANVDLALMPGEIHALVGENGSGKSTLCMVFSGIYRPDSGIIFIDGAMVRPENPRHAQALGAELIAGGDRHLEFEKLVGESACIVWLKKVHAMEVHR